MTKDEILARYVNGPEVLAELMTKLRPEEIRGPSDFESEEGFLKQLEQGLEKETFVKKLDVVRIYTYADLKWFREMWKKEAENPTDL